MKVMKDKSWYTKTKWESKVHILNIQQLEITTPHRRKSPIKNKQLRIFTELLVSLFSSIDFLNFKFALFIMQVEGNSKSFVYTK